jgi:hypothetical protein
MNKLAFVQYDICQKRPECSLACAETFQCTVKSLALDQHTNNAQDTVDTRSPNWDVPGYDGELISRHWRAHNMTNMTAIPNTVSAPKTLPASMAPLCWSVWAARLDCYGDPGPMRNWHTAVASHMSSQRSGSYDNGHRVSIAWPAHAQDLHWSCFAANSV